MLSWTFYVSNHHQDKSRMDSAAGWGVYKNATVASSASETPINFMISRISRQECADSPLHILFHTFLVRVNHGKNSKWF